MIKICTVIGTRPEAIKMAVLIRKLNAHNAVHHHLCVTAQHREMLDQVLDFFELIPDDDLNIMEPSQQLADITAKMLSAVSQVYTKIKPDLVLVHGDTNTCLAATLAAFYMNIPVAHVEAGLRTHNMQAPFPEEANRVLTSKLASWHFAPTQLNANNLLNEGIPAEQIIQTGNTVIDSLIYTSGLVHGFTHHVTNQNLKPLTENDKILLVTGHRRENFGEGFIEICKALKEIAIRHSDIKIIYPVHLNPEVKQPVLYYLSDLENIILSPPLSYPDFVYLMKISWLILTDSGGIQEEGPALGKPVLVMRDVTERPEAIDAGTVKLVGAKSELIINQVEELISNQQLYIKMTASTNPYGDGKATDRIMNWIISNQQFIKKEML